MDNAKDQTALGRTAQEREMAAYEELARASGELVFLGLSTLELEVIMGLFLNDGFTDGFCVYHDPTSLLQAVALWPDRALNDWEKLFETLSFTPVFQRYRLKRDILVARSRFSAATNGER